MRRWRIQCWPCMATGWGGADLQGELFACSLLLRPWLAPSHRAPWLDSPHRTEGRMSDDLVTWLRGILNEDEQAGNAYSYGACDADGVHVDYQWWLADIAAKRALLELHAELERKVYYTDSQGEHEGHRPVCEHCVPKWGTVTRPDPYPCQTVRVLAAAYADRPGYREEWRP